MPASAAPGLASSLLLLLVILIAYGVLSDVDPGPDVTPRDVVVLTGRVAAVVLAICAWGAATFS